jgi:ATP-binding cassette subfamily B protein
VATASRRSGDLVQRVTADTRCVDSLVFGVWMSAYRAAVTFGIMFVIMWSLSPWLTIAAVAAAVPMPLVVKLFSRQMSDNAVAEAMAAANTASVAEQMLGAVAEIQTFGAEDRERAHFERTADQQVEVATRTQRTYLRYGLAIGSLTALGTAGVMIIAGGVTTDSISVGVILVFISYISALYSPIEGFAYLSQTMAKVRAGAARVSEVLGGGGGVVDPVVPVAVPVPVVGGGLSVVLEGVTFGYVPARPVLRGVDLRVEAGQVVALVGATGAGKSTLVSLIPRLVDPWEGRVLLGGLDVRDARVRDVRGLVAMVRQEPLLLPVSIGENIAYGRPGASVHEVERAAREALVWEFVERLPDGLDTVVGERGATLSGGQRQRVAIARALLKDAPVLVLDEPTSALDAESESLVMAALDRVCVGRTVLVIAHRLSTVRAADRVVVLEHGMVLEQGSHAELLALNGTYAHYHNLQLLGDGGASESASRTF